MPLLKLSKPVKMIIFGLAFIATMILIPDVFGPDDWISGGLFLLSAIGVV